MDSPFGNFFPGHPGPARALGAAPPPVRTVSPVVDPGAGADPITAQNPALRGGGHLLTADSQVLLTAYNVTSGLTLRVSGVVLTPLGEYSVFRKDFAIANSGAEVLNAFSVGRGQLMSVYVSVVAGTPGTNDVYAEVGILEGTLVSRIYQVAVLLAGNVSATRTLGQSTPSGLNAQLGTPSVYNTNGAAATMTFTVPTGKQALIRQIRVNYLSDATAGNRLMILTATSGAQNVGVWIPRYLQAASLNYTYTFGPGLIDFTAPVQNPVLGTIYYGSFGIPPLHLYAGDTIAVQPSNALGSDTMTFVVAYDLFSA